MPFKYAQHRGIYNRRVDKEEMNVEQACKKQGKQGHRDIKGKRGVAVVCEKFDRLNPMIGISRKTNDATGCENLYNRIMEIIRRNDNKARVISVGVPKPYAKRGGFKEFFNPGFIICKSSTVVKSRAKHMAKRRIKGVMEANTYDYCSDEQDACKNNRLFSLFMLT